MSSSIARRRRRRHKNGTRPRRHRRRAERGGLSTAAAFDRLIGGLPPAPITPGMVVIGVLRGKRLDTCLLRRSSLVLAGLHQLESTIRHLDRRAKQMGLKPSDWVPAVVGDRAGLIAAGMLRTDAREAPIHVTSRGGDA